MAMTYTSLSAAKGTSGSIANWVNYTLLDIPPILDEAQALIYSLLRAREMRTMQSYYMAQGTATIAAPTGFLDPIGRMYAPTLNLSIRHKDENFILRNRNYENSSGTLATNPLTTTSGSTKVSVSFPAHGFSEESTFYITGTTAVGGITPIGSFNITSITDADNFVIETLSFTATSSAAGGGAAISYVCDALVQGNPYWWAIWDEKIHFDAAFAEATQVQLQYFRSLPLLSSTNTTNFLTTRYPQLLRTACVAAAADFMKDDTEYQKQMSKLTAMIAIIAPENDMFYRGVEIDAETP